MKKTEWKISFLTFYADICNQLKYINAIIIFIFGVSTCFYINYLHNLVYEKF